MTDSGTVLLRRAAASPAEDLDIVMTGPPRPSRLRDPRFLAAAGAAFGFGVAAWFGLLFPALVLAAVIVGAVLLVPQLQRILDEKRLRDEREGEAMANWFANLRTSGTWNDDVPVRPRLRPRSPGRHRANP